VRSGANCCHLLAAVYQAKRKLVHTCIDQPTDVSIADRALQRRAEIAEPPLREIWGDWQQIVAMLKWQIRRVAVAIAAAQPFGEKALLSFTLIPQMATKQYPQ